MTTEPGEIFENVIGNDFEVVRQALAADPSLVAQRDPYLGSTPLHFACHRGFTEIVVALLEAGADVHAREEASDTTPLHWAAEGGHPAIARMLVARGADLEALDGWHRLSPLGWATVVTWEPKFHAERAATAAYLVEAGARLDVFTAVVTRRGDALRAMAAGRPDALSRRLGFVDAEMQPLHLAVARRLVDMVPLLLDLGGDPAARTSGGMSALALALKNDDAATADLLRGRGAVDDASTALVARDVARLEASLSEAPEPAGTLLFTAAEEGIADAIAPLVRAGAGVNVRVRHLLGERAALVAPLHLAAMNGHEATTRALLDAGAAPSPGADDGTPTPLHVAAGAGHLAVARLLVERGADLTAHEKGFGATPLGWAEHGGHGEVMALLKDG